MEGTLKDKNAFVYQKTQAFYVCQTILFRLWLIRPLVISVAGQHLAKHLQGRLECQRDAYEGHH